MFRKLITLQARLIDRGHRENTSIMESFSPSTSVIIENKWIVASFLCLRVAGYFFLLMLLASFFCNKITIVSITSLYCCRPEELGEEEGYIYRAWISRRCNVSRYWAWWKDAPAAYWPIHFDQFKLVESVWIFIFRQQWG